MPNRETRAESRYRSASGRLADLLRATRVEARLSQEKLAREARVSVNTIRKIESKQAVEPGYFTVVAIARALGLGLDELDQ
jgi:transcriptional regulator with XRE-family HTH domain